MVNNRHAFGIIAIFAGIIILLGKLGFFTAFWPFLFIALGIGIHLAYTRNYIASQWLVLAGISVTYGLLFLYCNLVGWDALSWLWPAFIFGIAVGLYHKYRYSGTTTGTSLVGAIVLTVISVVFFFLSIIFQSGATFLAVLMILIGGYVIYRGRNR
jgi:hypothetical protein